VAAWLVLVFALPVAGLYTAFVIVFLVLPMPLAWFFTFCLSKAGFRTARERIAEAAATGAKRLDLSALGLRSLPTEIGQLTALQHLHLGNNWLKSLPPEIGQLTALEELRLGGNRLRSPPRKVVRQGVDAIRAYLREPR
jgi:hypothetical protein